MKVQTGKWVAVGVAGVMSAAGLGLFSVTPAEASTKGRRNTTIGAAAVTAYGLAKKKRGVAVAGAVGTGVAYSRYRSSKKRDRRTAEARRRAWYQQRYGSNWRRHYRPGT
jgi:hypothetical protein